MIINHMTLYEQLIDKEVPILNNVFGPTEHIATVVLTLQPPNYSIWIFTHLKLCLADAIHNFKWVKIIQIWQNGGHLFSNIADWCHIKRWYVLIKNENPNICDTGV